MIRFRYESRRPVQIFQDIARSYPFSGDVTINNSNGPCGRCLSQVPDILPEGANLNVRWIDENGTIQIRTITGRID